MSDTNESPLIQALGKKKAETTEMSKSAALLEMILAQVTKVADHFTKDDQPEKIVTTQESHA